MTLDALRSALPGSDTGIGPDARRRRPARWRLPRSPASGPRTRAGAATPERTHPGPRPDLLAGLNPVQAQAVAHSGGPLLIVAGAGSGKTRVLTHRIAWLIAEQGVSPFEILAITFTNKAAQEMRERVEALVGPVARRMWVSTFHAACVRILRRDASRLGYKGNFTIYDQADAVRLTGYVIRDLNLDSKRFPPRAIHGLISAAKNELLDFETYSARSRTIMERRVADVYREYQQRLLAANAMDFDDLLLVAVNVLQACPDVLEHYRERFRHVLVDEYQDTNRAQNELVLLLAGVHHRVSVVGDSDQSVYGWRGADIRNILQFEEAFPDATVVVLEQNYRSTQTILDAANAVISNNASRRPKALWTEQGPGESVVRYHAEDEHDEGRWLAAEVLRLHGGTGGPGTRRQPASSPSAPAPAVPRRPPAATAGATSRCSTGPTPRAGPSRKNSSGRTSLTRWWAVPGSTIGPRSRTCSPTCGPSPTRWTRCHSSASSTSPSAASATPAWPGWTATPASTASPSPTSWPTPRRPASAARRWRASPICTPARRPARRACRKGSARPGCWKRSWSGPGTWPALVAEHTVEAAGRIENIEELVGAAHEADNLDEFLEQVSLVADADEVDGDASRVTLMTLHTAKGLEYPVVFIVGMEDGVFPHLRSLGEADEMEEERRLAYVGITRARERLYLSYAWCRNLWGQTQYNPPSRFLKEIPDTLVRAATGGRRPAARLGDRSGRDAIVEAAMRRGKVGPVHGTGAETLGPARRRDGRPRQVGRRRGHGGEGGRGSGRGQGPLPVGGGEAPGPVVGPDQAGLDRPEAAVPLQQAGGRLAGRRAGQNVGRGVGAGHGGGGRVRRRRGGVRSGRRWCVDPAKLEPVITSRLYGVGVRSGAGTRVAPPEIWAATCLAAFSESGA